MDPVADTIFDHSEEIREDDNWILLPIIYTIDLTQSESDDEDKLQTLDLRPTETDIEKEGRLGNLLLF